MIASPIARALLLLCLACACSTSRTSPSTAEATVRRDAPADLTVAQARADFDALRAALEEAHGGLHRFATPAEVARCFDAFRARLDRPMSRRAFIAFIAEVVADARDGHAQLEYDEATSAALAGARLFPLRVALEGERLVVVSNDTPDDSTIRPGMEVTRIGGRPVAEIVAAILPKIPGDGFIETGKRVRLARGFARWYWLFVDSSETFAVTARPAAGRSRTVTLRGVTAAERERNDNPVNARIRAARARLDPPSGNLSLTALSDGVARLRVRAFDGASFTSELEALVDSLRARGTRALVLDLRGNGGGVDEYGAFLVSRFVERPFRYFDRIHLVTIRPSFATWKPSTFDDVRAGTAPDPAGGYLVLPTLHPGVALQQPAARPFSGALYVLTDGGTFSTAADVAALLHQLKRATFVGEETGGGYEGNTSGLNALFVLPNSRLRLKIMMYEYWNAVQAPVHGRGTLPDHLVAQRVADLLDGVDAPLARADSLARERLGRP